MKPVRTNHDQGRLLETRLSDQLNPTHTLLLFSQLIDWTSLEEDLAVYFCESTGAPAKPTRLIAGILMLQHFYGLSDEQVVAHWVENPYWQLFCGYDYLQWSMPIDPSSLVKWRQRLGSQGIQKILNATMRWALDIGAVKRTSLKQVIVDTTVMPKNITYPTDAKLYLRGMQTLVRFAKKFSIPLRQTYTFLGKEALRKASSYAHARQMKRAARECRRLKTYLGRLRRDLEKGMKVSAEEVVTFAKPMLEVIDQVLKQQRHDTNKVYSIHEPHVECISKGKAHKKYEFGCKTSLVITHKEGLALGASALHGNPYDGHTLQNVLKEAESASGVTIERAFVDKGYRGHQVEGKEIYISGRRGLSPYFKKLLKRRQAIEPHIGHMKSEGRLDRNYLHGKMGDHLNAILCGIGHNMRLIIRYLNRHQIVAN